jgi:hypothetical protein
MQRSREHLVELIEEAKTPAPDVQWMQPPGIYVSEAEEDFGAAGFEPKDLPWGAIAMRAHEIKDENE